jgi:outer membrane protein TolC
MLDTCLKKVLMIVILVFVAAPGYISAETLPELVRTALENNPELKAALERSRQYSHRIPQAKSLDDPILSFAFSNYPSDNFSSDETPMTGNEFRLAQKFPFPGKLDAREDQAKQQAAWYEAVYRDGRLQLARKVKDAWYQLYFQDRAISVTEHNLALLDDVVSLTETRYSVGQGLQQDVLKAHVERSRLLDRLITLRQKRTSVLADLNTLLNRSPATELETPEQIDWVDVDTTLQDLLSSAEQNRPVYEAYRSLVNRYRAEGRLADLDDWPDMTLWAGYRFRDDDLADDGTDFVSAGISVNLPVYRDKRKAAVAEAGAGLRMAQRQFDDFRGKVHFNIHDSYSTMQKQKEQAELYSKGLVPQATQSLNAAMNAYQVGTVEFISLLDALMKLYLFEMDYYRIQSEYHRTVARLEAESGASIVGPDMDDDYPDDKDMN